MKPPQDRKTPYQFTEWMDDDEPGISPAVRAHASSSEVRFARRYPSETRYSHAFTLYGRESVEELRDFLDAWLDAQGDDDEDN